MDAPGGPRVRQAPGRPTAAPAPPRMGPAAWTALLVGAAAAFLVVIIGTAATERRPPVTASLLPPPPTPPDGRPAPRGLLGAGSCTSSGCHAAPVEGHAAWQSSFTVWASRDPHARAHAVLREPLAEAIVAALAVRSPDRAVVPAADNVACIGCHATGRGRMAAEGVGCESCHGAAGDWLVSHTLPGWRTAGNTLGMVDLADPFVAAGQCAGCHVGGPPADDGAPREVSHDLIAAGHPRLAFELRGFKEAEPPHWRDRFAADRGPSSDAQVGGQTGTQAAASGGSPAAAGVRLDPVDEWALGRLGSLRVFLGQVARQSAAAERRSAVERKAPDGPLAAVWPEFTAFDCYGCHRPALVGHAADPSRDPSRDPTANPGGLGVPRLEPLHWALLDTILPAGATTLATFRADVERRWWQVPDAAALAESVRAIDAARHAGHAPLAALPAGPLAERVVRGVAAADWDEAAAGLAALRAIADRAAARGAQPAALTPARERLDRLRGLLEFPVAAAASPDSPRAASATRFDSPHAYDAAAVSAALEAAAAALAPLP